MAKTLRVPECQTLASVIYCSDWRANVAEPIFGEVAEETFVVLSGVSQRSGHFFACAVRRLANS
jgi:hypothetical protein